MSENTTIFARTAAYINQRLDNEKKKQQANNPFASNLPTEKNLTERQKLALMAGSGVLIAGAGTAIGLACFNDRGEIVVPDQRTVAVSPTPVQINPSPDINVAVVDQNQGFQDAWADARESAGIGGIFMWHGKAYNTYSPDEWSALPKEKQERFLESLITEHKDFVQTWFGDDANIPNPPPFEKFIADQNELVDYREETPLDITNGGGLTQIDDPTIDTGLDSNEPFFS
jgi:hypothetical protein